MSLTTHYPDVITSTATSATTTTTTIVFRNRSSWLCDINNSDVWLLEYPVCTTKYDSIVVFVVVCAILSFITLWTIFGNVLVLVALYKYGTLRTMSNCLIGNLAISDFLLATTVLPISICNDLLGYWMFGELACTIWLLADVLYCTASVWGLCTVAFDRYMATVYPVWYHDQRSVEKAILCIVFVWIFSFIISFAPIIGWRHMIPNFFTFNAQMNSYECVLFMTTSYVIYSAVGSFIIPMCLMMFMYIRIFTVLHNKSKTLKRNVKRRGGLAYEKTSKNGCPAILEPLNPPTESVARDFTTTTLMSMSGPENMAHSEDTENGETPNETDHLITIPAVTLSVESTTPNGISEDTNHTRCSSNLAVQNTLFPDNSSISSNGNSSTHNGAVSEGTSLNNLCKVSNLSEFPILKRRSQSVSVQGCSPKSRKQSISFLDVSDMERRNSDQGAVYTNSSETGNSNSVTSNTLFSIPASHRSKSANVLNSSDEDGNTHSPRYHRRSLPCDLSKFGRHNRLTQSMKRRFEMREQRATKRMLLIMACFIVCWMPFVGMYLSRSLCNSCSMNTHFVSAFIWLGYVNSSLNPVLYSLFNDDFKSAFKKLLGCKTVSRPRFR